MILFFLLSVSLAQTKTPGPVSENPPIQIPLGKPAEAEKGKFRESRVLLDARPFFKFSNEHIEKSQPIRWEDYSDPQTGRLEEDTSFITRKLRSLGITPETEVIVLGEGKEGRGEEGRIAWMLSYVGVKKVKVYSYSQYWNQNKNKRSSQNWIQNITAPIWLAKENKNLKVIPEEFKKIKENSVLIDTSPKEIYEKKHLAGAVSIPWRTFLNNQGSPLTKEELRKILSHIDLNKEVIFYGQGSQYSVFIFNDTGLTERRRGRHYEGDDSEWQK